MTRFKKKRKKYPERAKEVPVTQAMLFDFRAEVKAQFSGVDARFSEVDARFDKIEAVVDQRFYEIKILVEEQNARNRIVLDGLTSLFARQERLEKKSGSYN